MKNEKWILFDAENIILGRLSSLISIKLMGKDNVEYSPNKIIGNQIIVINSSKIKISGNKINKKFYYKHSEYPSGLKKTSYKNMIEKNPNFIIKTAVKGMLPKNKLQKILLKRLKIYSNNKHPHQAQNPQIIKIK